MKRYSFIPLIAASLLFACAGQKGIIFLPDPALDRQELIDPLESWQIIESQNGSGETGIPEWVRRYYNKEIYGAAFWGIESLDQYSGKYIFTGENRGENYNALLQWANGFTAEHDLPRLVAARVERRLVSSASLYPDDEYGQFFENLIKKVSDGEYPGAVKEQTFWVKRKMIPTNAESPDGEIPAGDEQPQTDAITERYEFLVLISINREALQKQLQEIMAGIKTIITPTRDQTAKINKVQQTFFEGF